MTFETEKLEENTSFYRYIFGGCARSFAKALFFKIIRRQ
jgi:hypothetical protein